MSNIGSEDTNNNLVSKSTFACIEKNSLTYDEIKDLSKGDKLVKEIPVRFYKSFQTLSISIDSTRVKFFRSLDKPLIKKIYLPLHLESTSPYKIRFFNYLKRKIIKYIKFLKRRSPL
jgi:hypothetical protein